MRISYDPEADTLRVTVAEGVTDHSEGVEEGVTMDLDADGEILALEVRDACRRRAGAVRSATPLRWALVEGASAVGLALPRPRGAPAR